MKASTAESMVAGAIEDNDSMINVPDGFDARK